MHDVAVRACTTLQVQLPIISPLSSHSPPEQPLRPRQRHCYPAAAHLCAALRGPGLSGPQCINGVIPPIN